MRFHVCEGMKMIGLLTLLSSVSSTQAMHEYCKESRRQILYNMSNNQYSTFLRPLAPQFDLSFGSFIDNGQSY